MRLTLTTLPIVAIALMASAFALPNTGQIVTGGAITNADNGLWVHSASVDSMYFEIIGGETLIFALPDSLSGQKVESWVLPRPPAMSRLAERSFMWKTRKADRGTHTLQFEGTSNIIVDEYSVSRVELWTANVRVR